MSDNVNENIESDDDLEVEIVDDTPEQDRGRERRPETADADIPEDDEIASYSESVQKRIRKLKYEFHEERRAKEEAARLRDEAIEFARREREDRLKLQGVIQQGESALVAQAKQRVGLQIEQAKAAFKTAYESGDADAMAEAQANLAGLKAEEVRLSSFRPPQRPAAPTAQTPQAAQPQVQRPAPQQPSQRAREWSSANPWFGRTGDEDMTSLAMGVHERIIRSGVAPDSDEYYNQINATVRRAFPDRFADTQDEVKPQRRQAGNVVAPAGRAPAKTPRKVALTSTQVALAKRLGLTPQQYAAQVMKDAGNG